ncbi:MAG: ribonuclease III [Hymenobacteraceae bacterium]|nr:ribonuclease III [Hymenobacteraceae bacterium]
MVVRALFRLGAERKFAASIRAITGAAPRQLPLYHLALTHTSFVRGADNGNGNGKPDPAAERARLTDTNERLEFLGDAVLGSVVAEYLFRKFPYEAEGFLTELRARIVNRESLNTLAVRVGIDKLIKADRSQTGRHRSLNGNALEALVGAIYLDHGYRQTRAFILDKLIKPFVDIPALTTTTANFKSKLIEWGQAQGRPIRFELVSQQRQGGTTEFRTDVYFEDKLIASGAGLSRKASEQAAAEKSLKELGVA